MPDDPGTAVLDLSNDFPPVTTDEWEAAIRADLKGADYEKKLLWRTEEGITVRPYYRSEDTAGREADTHFRFPRAVEKLNAGPNAIRADHLHEAGATTVQELGYALAQAVERLDGGARDIDFVFAIGSEYFIEIAKMRAARLLWEEVAAAFGEADGHPRRVRIYARTSRRDKSTLDRYTDLLRATTEAMSAMLGGCDEVIVEPFGFDQHLAINVQRILREEAHLDEASDAASGSYYIEVVTDMLAREAWKLFQQVEQQGGYRKAVESSSIAQALGASRAAREKTVALRRHTLVGVNNYPDLKEKHSDVEPPAPEVQALPPFRLAEPFERIRERTHAHALKTGRYPKVLLLKRGDLKMRMARANFSLNFFGCAGFDIVESEDYAGTDADLIVLCSSDAEYLALAREVCPAVRVPVIVAGNPKDQIEALQAAGVQGFIHIGSKAVETLTEWQDRLGVNA